MSLSSQEIKRIARLARLELTPEEEQLYAGQIADVVDYIDQLERFAREEVHEPAMAPVEREDVASGLRLEPEAWLANAPAALDHFVLVPQVKKSD
ncbi:MAG TPA: Asp-tRNA(Asn)/Glu-tRNA(Gln) amidotransferase subunit GatC [Thermoanaerobaculia bacterium]|nr:Asp-tRNA(Asn)/Glu-tRNA(Gln) amidotransferase subunit GatC [Thermoanaerobaculia bacterium]